MSRQIKFHSRAPADFTVNIRVAFGLARKAIDHRQAKTRALTGRLRRKKGIEGSFYDFGAHARPRIRDGNADVLPRRDLVPQSGVRFVHSRITGLNYDGPAARHCVTCIEDQIQNRILKLVSVAQRCPQTCGKREFKVNSRRQGPPQQVIHR